MSKNYTLPIKMQISQEYVDNIVDSAINWCSHWCDLLEVSRKATEELPYNAMSMVITRGGELTFHIDEPFDKGGKQDFVLTIDNLLKGIVDYGNFDFDNFDGPISDAVVQQALFGKVIYG